MPSFRGRGGRGRGRGGRNDFRNDFNEDTEWSRKVRDNRDEQKLDLEFADYDGEKKHELPEDFVKMLNADKTEAKSEDFMLESDFGITEYVTSDSAGFSGILKHRFTDFVVHEISLNGEAVKLTDLSLPPDLNKVQKIVSSRGKIEKGILFFNCLGIPTLSRHVWQYSKNKIGPIMSNI